jgi:hypothetical protein
LPGEVFRGDGLIEAGIPGGKEGRQVIAVIAPQIALVRHVVLDFLHVMELRQKESPSRCRASFSRIRYAEFPFDHNRAKFASAPDRAAELTEAPP